MKKMSKRIDKVGKVIAVGFALLACVFNPDSGTPLLFCIFGFASVLTLLYTTDVTLTIGAEDKG